MLSLILVDSIEEICKMKRIKYSIFIVAFVFNFTIYGCQQKEEKDMANKEYNQLNDEERNVIINKGTEKPNSGKFNKNKIEGVYICKQCDAPLYISQDKFESNCGWPSFDDEILGAVKRKKDADGIREEILCNNCNGHLGHIFLGEKYTDKNTRHCVNSISLNFIPSKDLERAVFASGCFWGTEYFLKKQKGVLLTTVGYIGGHKESPTYKEVCTGQTGHAEATEVLYDPKLISYEEITKIFFETHNPTQVNRQGPDVGTQYRSEIFYMDDKQKQIAIKLMDILKDKGYNLATKLTKATKFWKAEIYHQDYYDKNGSSPYCHSYTKRF